MSDEDVFPRTRLVNLADFTEVTLGENTRAVPSSLIVGMGLPAEHSEGGVS